MLPNKEKNTLSVIDKAFNDILNDILQQKFKPGERLPGERELATLYGIGRSSMVKVLSRLQEERYIERVPVYGTFLDGDNIYDKNGAKLPLNQFTLSKDSIIVTAELLSTKTIPM